MTKAQAIAKADRIAKKTKREWFVVYEPDFDNGGPWFIADDIDLETWFAGTEPVYSTAE